MNSSDELVKLIEAVVEKKLNAARLNVQNITGGGGNTTVSSMGDVFLQPGVGKAAYYKGAEIGSSVGSGTQNKLVKRTTQTTLGDSNISDNGTSVTITLGTGGTLTLTRA